MCVCVCVCVCVYIYIYIYIYLYMCVCVYIYIYIYVRDRNPKQLGMLHTQGMPEYVKCIHRIYMYIHIYDDLLSNSDKLAKTMYIHVFLYAYLYAYTHTYILIYIYIHVFSRRFRRRSDFMAARLPVRPLYACTCICTYTYINTMYIHMSFHVG